MRSRLTTLLRTLGTVSTIAPETTHARVGALREIPDAPEVADLDA
jgi:hypothetical protein